jgi:DNA polymerase (family 10)
MTSSRTTSGKGGAAGARSARANVRVRSPTEAAPQRRLENAEVARLLRQMGELLEVTGANPFRVRAYQNAARVIEELPEPVEGLVRENPAKLVELPGIGEDLAGKIAEIVRTGTLKALEELRRQAPPGALTFMRIRGIGPRRARLLSERLGLRTLDDLERAAREGRIRTLPGFGEKTERAILAELQAHRFEEQRVLRATAVQYADELVRYLKATPGAGKVEAAGSLRRCRETVGDLDIVATAAQGPPMVQRFVNYPGAADVLARGRTRASIRLKSGLLVDLRVVPERSYGAALHYLTGSKAHNIAIRQRGQERGLKINEYGVYRGKRWIAGRTEHEVYEAVSLPWIPPELRENRGEIEAAERGELPRLVVLEDIRGDLQTHTTDSDGRDSLEAMAAAAETLGYEYIAVTDHSPAVRVAGGLDAAGFRRQWKRIDKLNSSLRGLTVLKGVEVDIHADGTLDLDDRTLAGFDIVVASVHSHFDLPEKRQTERLLKAIRHPSVHIIGHPTGRMIGRRAPMAFDVDAVLSACAVEGVALEVNAQPQRLDLDDILVRRAIEAGVQLVIGSDAHATAELLFMRWGVDQARRGWAARSNVLNTLALKDLLRQLRPRPRS